MQRIFAEPTEWHTPSMAAILPNIVRLAEARPEATLYSRFTVPANAVSATGRWQAYYERWSMFTGETMDPGLIDLVEPLGRLAVPGSVYDKPTYSLFEASAFVDRLAAEGTDTLLFTGVETDVCVLATLLAAVDRGFRVVAVADALTSSSEASHRAVLDLVLPRMPDQIEIATTDAVLAAWRE
ncbi:MAG: cysteine hydrolase [Rhizobiaceae bacterium]|nr:cysteine hydrolase [Rhizobiaceae bacterium]